ncbi:MAG TPA: saccharopine dehydrogenase NADP-binding domain-containing protein [Candidatus Acidoferrum sp.]|nr:saccharopine dehydrogenase NADP-binding domain-containing protein [Candidatus Acidoferrum sp.]
MRIFILGAGATGSLLAQLLERQGHVVWCGDRDPARARRFLGKKSAIPVATVNARNLRAIVKAAKGCQLIVNASASVFNEIVLRAALRLRANYLDLSSHLTRHPFKPEQVRYKKKFEEKHRAALINTGAAPGLTNLLVKRAAELLDEVHSVHIRLYESTESDDPISQWSPEVSFDEAISHPRIYRNGKYQLTKRFAELEKFRFPDPIGAANVVLAAQDEVATLPHYIPMRELDVKIGGNEFDRLRRWHKQGKLSKSRGIPRQHFPETSSPRKIASLIRQGVLQNARFAASVIVTGLKRAPKEDQRLAIRSDAMFPTLYQIRRQGRVTTPVAYATAHVASMFIKNFPRDAEGVFPPEALSVEVRRAILAGIKKHGVKITNKVTPLKPAVDEEELL